MAAFASAGDKTLNLPWASMPAPAFLLMASTDQFVHGWHLAKATRQATDLDPELAADLLAFYRQAIADEFRGPRCRSIRPQGGNEFSGTQLRSSTWSQI